MSFPSINFWGFNKIAETGGDADALAFLSATGITDATISTAINDFVVGLKTDNLWTEIFTLYPFVGGTADTHKYNLKDARDLDAAFRITWNGTVTHNANGVQGNGSTGYGDTHINDYLDFDNFTGSDPVSDTNWSKGVSIYSRTNSAATSLSFGAYEFVSGEPTNNRLFHVYLRFTDGNTYYRVNNPGGALSANPNTLGLHTYIKLANNNLRMYKNGSLQNTSTSLSGSSGSINRNIFLLAENNNNSGLRNASNRNYAMFAFHKAFDATQSANFYTRVQALQTALSRQV